MFTHLPRPAIIAHRGSSAHAPENTMAAFELAVRQGADAIELDVKLSADGYVMVIHDQTVDRTTPHKGRVRDLTLAELQRLDAGSYFDYAFRKERIPTLDEVFAGLGHQIMINVELTNYASPLDDLPKRVAELVRFYEVSRQVFFSSFNPIALLRIRRYIPDAPVAILAMPGKNGAWARSGLVSHWLGCQALHPERTDVTPALVDRAHRRNQRVHVYTVNQAEEMRRLLDLGADGIFTDDPVLARQVMKVY